MELFSFFTKKESSKNIAKDRLKLVLVHDRSNCSAQVIEMLKNDIIKVISNYMEIDEDGLDIQIATAQAAENDNQTTKSGIQITKTNNQTPAIYASIPIKGMRKVQD